MLSLQVLVLVVEHDVGLGVAATGATSTSLVLDPCPVDILDALLAVGVADTGNLLTQVIEGLEDRDQSQDVLIGRLKLMCRMKDQSLTEQLHTSQLAEQCRVVLTGLSAFMVNNLTGSP